MEQHLFALLIHDQTDPFEDLKSVLKELSVETCSVWNLEEAERLVPQTEPHMIFTAPSIGESSWPAVMRMAGKNEVPINVIVVGPRRDAKLSLSTLARGAFACISPPFDRQALDYVVWAAGEDVRNRRRALVRYAAATAECR